MPVPAHKKLIPDLTFVHALPTDTDEVLQERVSVALPRILSDLGRQAGEAAWRDMPAAMDMPEADKKRLVRETADAYQRKLTQREMNDIAEDVYRRLKQQRDEASGPGVAGPG